MKLLIANNINAGPGDGAVYDFMRMAIEDGDEICMRATDGTTDIASLLTDAQRFDAVVVAGGDGSVSRSAYALAYSGVPILPFPSGTANLIATNLNSPYEPHALAKLAHERRTLDFDLGEMEAGGERFGFAVMAGAGFDARIMTDAQPTKKLLGPIAYFQAAAKNPMPQKSRIHLDVDGDSIEREGLGVLLVNFSKMQFDVTVTHENEPRDGEFGVVILKAENAFGLIPAFIAGLLDRDGGFPGRTDSLEIMHGKSVFVEADPPFEIQYDGETPSLTTPFEAHVLKSAARFIVSEEGFGLFSD